MAAFEVISKFEILPRNTDQSLDVRTIRLPSGGPPDSDYDPYEQRDPKAPIRPWMAYFNLLRTMLGPGLLGMPVAISASGMIGGVVLTILTGMLVIHTHQLLLLCLKKISARLQVPIISYRYGFRLALLRGPPIWHGFGHKGPTMIAVLMFLSQLGICTVSVILTADSVRDIADLATCKQALYILLPCYLFMVHYMSNLGRISHLALFGAFLNMVGLVLIFYQIFKEPLREYSLYETGVGGWLFTYGMCMFNLSAVAVVLALEKALKYPRIMVSTYGVVNMGLGIPTVFSSVFGGLGYWAFGTMEENILRSLPYCELTSMFAIGAYLLAVAVTYPLHCYPGITVLLEVIKNQSPDSQPAESTLKMIEKILRPSFVLLSFTIAYFVPFQGPFVAFVGILLTTLLSVIFPVMMDISLRYGDNDYGKYRFYLIKDLAILIMGVIFWIFGIYFCAYLIYVRILSSYSPNSDTFL